MKLTIIALFSTLSLSLFSSTGTITVTGEGKKEITADQWSLAFSIDEKTKDKNEVNARYNKTKSEMLKRLSDLGVSEKELQTTSFYISPWYEWENNTNELRGHQAHHELALTLQNLEKISKIVGSLSTLKSISIQNIGQELKKETMKKESDELYALAFQDAKRKIEAITKAAELKVKNISSISEEGVSFAPLEAMRTMNFKAASSNETPLSLSLNPSKIGLQTTLKVVVSVE